LSKVANRLKRKDIKLRISPKAKELLAREGFDPNLGARPLKRVIQKTILDPLSLKIVIGEVQEGGAVYVEDVNGKIALLKPEDIKKAKTAKEKEEIIV